MAAAGGRSGVFGPSASRGGDQHAKGEHGTPGKVRDVVDEVSNVSPQEGLLMFLALGCLQKRIRHVSETRTEPRSRSQSIDVG